MKPFAFATLLLLAGQLAAQAPPSAEVRSFIKVDAPVVALTHVRVVDGTGAPAREDQTAPLARRPTSSHSSSFTWARWRHHTRPPGASTRPAPG